MPIDPSPTQLSDLLFARIQTMTSNAGNQFIIVEGHTVKRTRTQNFMLAEVRTRSASW